MSAKAVALSSPLPNSSGAEPTPPNPPQPSPSTETRIPVRPNPRYSIPFVEMVSVRAIVIIGAPECPCSNGRGSVIKVRSAAFPSRAARCSGWSIATWEPST